MDNTMVQVGDGRYINKDYLSDAGAAMAANYANSIGSTSPSTTFDSSRLSTDTKSLALPQPEISTFATALSGEAQGVFDTSTILQDEQNKIDKAAEEDKTWSAGLKETMAKILKLQGDRPKAEEEAGINQMTQDVNKANQAYLISQRAEQNELRAIAERKDISLDAKYDMQAAVNRKYAFQNADNALALSLARQDLATAQGLLDKKYQLQLEPLQNLLDFQKFFYEKNQDQLSKAEQNKLQLMIAANERQYNFKLAEYNRIGDLAMLAGQNGAPTSLVTQISNAKTPQDAIALAGQYLRSQLGDGVPTVKTINGVDMQWNPRTQQWDNIGSSTSNDEKTKDQLTFLLDTAKNAKDLSKASGASGVSKFIGDKLIGDTKFRQLESYTNTLRTNVLTLMTDPGVKKYFGPQMSEADVRLMTAAGTTLNPENQSPKQLGAEIDRLTNLLTRMQTAVNGGSPVTNKTASGAIFDVAGAKAAGYTQAQIDEYLRTH